MDRLTGDNLKGYVKDNVEQISTVMTDELSSYVGLDEHFVKHETVKHSAKEYVRGGAHTNTAEGYFSLLKKGIVGVYHHVSKHHLQRYLTEFDFRYNARTVDDAARTLLAIKGVGGKRLMYRDSSAIGV